MIKQPFVGITVAFCLGIFIASKIKLSFLVLYILAILIAGLCYFLFKKEKIFPFLLFFLLFLLGGLFLVHSDILPKNHLVHLASAKGREVSLEGVIESDPILRLNNKISFVLEAKKLEICGFWHKVSGRVLVKAPDIGLFYGDKIILKGRLYKPFNFSVGGKLNYRDYLKYKGIYVVLNVKDKVAIKKIKSRQGNFLIWFIFKIRHRLNKMINKNLSHLAGSILKAVILGLREDLPPHIRERLVNTGTVHIIAISGLHLGIVAFIVLVFLKTLRLCRRPRYNIAIFTLFIYCILTGANVPVVRAMVMAAILLFGYVINRQPDIYNSLCIAALIILFINPQGLFEVSFQLSFMSIFSLAWLAPKIISLFPDRLKKSKYGYFLLNLFCASLAAWLSLFPFIAYYFKIISPITVLANMVVVPYMTILVACSFVFLFIGLLFPPLINLFSSSVEIPILFLLKFLSFLDRIPFGHFPLSL